MYYNSIYLRSILKLARILYTIILFLIGFGLMILNTLPQDWVWYETVAVSTNPA